MADWLGGYEGSQILAYTKYMYAVEAACEPYDCTDLDNVIEAACDAHDCIDDYNAIEAACEAYHYIDLAPWTM